MDTSPASDYCYSLGFRLFGTVWQSVGHTGSYISVCVSGLGMDTSPVFQTIVIVWVSDYLVQSGRVLDKLFHTFVYGCMSC